MSAPAVAPLTGGMCYKDGEPCQSPINLGVVKCPPPTPIHGGMSTVETPQPSIGKSPRFLFKEMDDE